ncbi:AMP-binding enzyme [uncultured delta proteobacterium]|uniref:AMP-binding enzyme n=1 Tax=uncultured delta proteobacterium TaxID=34034 RepID=A0A212JPJ6_9DELT|nr:AMP-binding enzyme [uncultured delta proteobacterium]
MADTTTTPAAPAPANGQTGTIIGLGSCYALGTFTDNFYKQAAILMAASGAAAGAGTADMLGFAVSMNSVQGIATVLFSLPFILFSAWGGAVADRVAKKNIAVAAKSLEFLALFMGGYMLITQNWAGILAVIFLMGTQSTFFSPAINGSIPENFTPERVPRANALIKLASTAAILAGFAMAGFVLDIPENAFGGLFGLSGEAYGRGAAAVFIVVVALLGLVTALTLRRRPPAGGENVPFPWAGPVQSIVHTRECRKDKDLVLALVADAWFYGIAAIAVISIANLAAELGYSKSVSGVMMALLMIGVAAGAVAGGRFSVESWRRLVLPVGSAMAASLFLVAVTPHIPAYPSLDMPHGSLDPQFLWFGITLFLSGFFGGMYIIPLESFIQVRPAAHEKGKVIAVSNFMSFVAMAIFGLAFRAISLLPPALTFAAYGIATFLFLWLGVKTRLVNLPGMSMADAATNPLGLLLRLALSLRYRVTATGLESIAPPVPVNNGTRTPGILILPNHPAMVDPIIVYSRLAGLAPRPLSDEAQMRGFVQRIVARILHVVTIPDLEKNGGRGDAASARQSLGNISQALRQGDNVLLYPSGRVYRSAREVLGNKSAVSRLLAEVPGARVLLVRTTGLWGSSFSYASGKTPQIMRQLFQGALTLLGNLLFFAPRRAVSVEFVEPADLPRDGDKLRLNAYLENFYNKAETQPILVPRFFWQPRGTAKQAERGSQNARKAETTRHGAVPTDSATVFATVPATIPEDIRDAVYAVLRDKGGLAEDHPLDPDQSLTEDLHFDSLSLMEAALELEAAFGHPVASPEDITTVGDCLRLAAGLLQAEDEVPPADVPAAWLAPLADGAAPRRVAPGARNMVDTFLALARENPDAPLAAERSGIRTRKALLTGMLALSKRFAALPGKRLGIMLPSVPAALAIWLAAMHAGKEPVFINWTVGRRNLEHCLALAGVGCVVSASALMDQVSRTGTPLEELPVTWLAAEKIAASLSVLEKLRAALGAALHCSALPFTVRGTRVPEIAAVLFTSGSETRPKGVPLSHTNIMCNAADVLAVLRLTKDDKLLAMLPPFHSFGLLVGLALPAATGIPAAYHPNPTESAHLNAMVRDFKATVFGATPTFLDGMLTKAKGKNDLASLRYAFAGAEKCPDHVYKSFAAVCPAGALCEGYGITECSPVVAVNRPEDPVAGSIGPVLPSVQAVLVREDDDADGHPVITGRAAPGETGMLLVRGPSVFSGYLSPENGAPVPSPFVRFDDKDWYRTGDLVMMDETGRLFFKGRRKRFVKLGGEMVSLPQMEEVLQEAFAALAQGLDEGKPFIAVADSRTGKDTDQAELVAFTTLALSVQEINQALRHGGLSPLHAVRTVTRLEAIPLLGSGKTDYRALQGQA